MVSLLFVDEPNGIPVPRRVFQNARPTCPVQDFGHGICIKCISGSDLPMVSPPP